MKEVECGQGLGDRLPVMTGARGPWVRTEE